MVRIVTPLMLLTLFAGCATGAAGGRWVFEKTGVPEAELKRDRCECFAEAVDANVTDRGGLMRVDRETYKACMEKRGYTLRGEQ